MSARSNNQLRPGSRLGIYPQRESDGGNWSERLLGKAIQRSLQAVPWRRHRLSNVPNKVNEAAAEMTLDALDDAALRGLLDKIRYAMHREGLTKPLLYQSFALIREYASRVLALRHYHVQLQGGWVIVNGDMAEMATGEGKSLTATLAAASAALAGIPVHLITTNEYLAERDAEAMRPLYEAMGLSVNAVTEAMDAATKRQAYLADIVYCSNKNVAFDYLRDRLAANNESGKLSLQFSQAGNPNQLVMRGLCFAIIDEVDSILIDEARTPLILSREHHDATQHKIYQQALTLAGKMRENHDFTLLQREQRLSLTDHGSQHIAEQSRDFQGIWTGKRHREFLIQQALTALHLYHRDLHYLVRDQKIEIIDKNTGRTTADRSWQQGLHQMIEAKEACPLTGQRETLASIGYQRFFMRYLRVGGMSGTLRQVAAEMRSVYDHEITPIPNHLPCARVAQGFSIYRRAHEKWLAVFSRVEAIHRSGQPVLVGTGSLHDSELLSKLLNRRNLSHRLLNARQDRGEAEIVASAGQRGMITVATNMAGRGTDIKLGLGVAELGGLHVLVTECNEEYRVDRQLIGRSARQGDPGTFEIIGSLNDPLIHNFYGDGLRRLLGRFAAGNKPLPQWLSKLIVKIPQRVNQRYYRNLRRDLMHRDLQLEKLLAYSGRQE